MGVPITEDEFALARGDLALRQALMARALDLLLARIGRLYANKPAAGSAAAAQLREAIALAVRLADRLQAPAARLPS